MDEPSHIGSMWWLLSDCVSTQIVFTSVPATLESRHAFPLGDLKMPNIKSVAQKRVLKSSYIFFREGRWWWKQSRILTCKPLSLNWKVPSSGRMLTELCTKLCSIRAVTVWNHIHVRALLLPTPPATCSYWAELFSVLFEGTKGLKYWTGKSAPGTHSPSWAPMAGSIMGQSPCICYVISSPHNPQR